MRISLNEVVQKSFGQDTVMEWSEPVSGGDINEAYHLLLNSGEEVFVKLHAGAKEILWPGYGYGVVRACFRRKPMI